MKLYYALGACSLSPHIILCESGLDYSVEKVDLKTHTLASGKDYYKVNAKGQVPTLRFEDGTILTEGPAVVQYIADLVPEKNLLAPVGDILRYQTISWLNFVATELHKNFGPIFHPQSEDAKAAANKTLISKLIYVDEVLKKQAYIAGENFTVADAYLFTVLNWRKFLKDLPKFDAIDEYQAKVGARPAVIKALSEEK